MIAAWRPIIWLTAATPCNGLQMAKMELVHSGSVRIGIQELELARFYLNQSSLALFRHGSDGRFVYVNPKACESLGYSLEELLNLSVHDIDPTVTPDSWPAIWQRMCETGTLTFESVHKRIDLPGRNFR